MLKAPSNHQVLCVAILFGGKSAEHDVSVQSAQNVVAALDHKLFKPVLIRIASNGGWCKVETPDSLAKVTPQTTTPDLTLLEGVDAVFPVLHGPMGEDGTLQGLLELMNIPYVGPGVLSSAINMDKDVMKRLLQNAGVAVAPFVTVTLANRHELNAEAVVRKLGLPLFVKPANMGSSIGVSQVANIQDLLPAIEYALRFDCKILIETAVKGQEIECAILGNEHPEASVIGQIIPRGSDFYSYEAKYHDADGTVLEIPAQLPELVTQKARQTALQVYEVLACEGMARVDMFATKDNQIVVNEVNTIPGFTKFSMYPQLWEASGVGYAELLTRLFRLAIERAQERAKLLTTSPEMVSR